MAGSYRFEGFRLDLEDRQLTLDGAPVELNARYLDALALLVREQGRLVAKDRFLEEVWRGVPVTDEALTQCIRTIRRQLGDDAARPRFIETVPKHGYRFIGPVETAAPASAPAKGSTASAFAWRTFLWLGAGGTLGGGLAGVLGGLFYGFAGAAAPLQSGMGATSILLVLTAITALLALAGGAGVSFGMAAGFAAGRPWPWVILGGAGGGLVVGTVVKLLGLDAFNLLFGQAPAGITGAFEGVVLGGAIGLGGWLACRGAGPVSIRRGVALAVLAGGAAGVIIALLGGRLMGGSLDLLARQFPASRLRLDSLGQLFGETGLGPVSQGVTAGLEGALFGGCLVAGLLFARRALGPSR